ncbi:hypothetical protein D3C85_1492300 [compost metagenome]
MGLRRQQANPPALLRADPLHQRQAEPQAVAALGGAAHERLEYRRAQCLGNPLAAILDTEAPGGERQADRPAVGVVPGIAQQVAQHRTQQCGVVAG